MIFSRIACYSRSLSRLNNSVRWRSTSTMEKLKELRRKYKVKPEVDEFITRRAEVLERSGVSMSVLGLRKLTELYTDEFNPETVLDGKSWESYVPVNGVPDGIPVTIYKCSNCPTDPAIFVYYHGGGLVLGSRKTSKSTCISICNYAKCVVINVEYRMSPEVKAPTIVSDARETISHIMKNRHTYGGTSRSVIGIGGDSGGGHIAVHTAHDVPGISFQTLIYPSIDKTWSLPSCKEFADDLIIPKVAIEWFAKQQFDRVPDLSDPSISALFRPSFRGLPPTLLIAAQIDPLRDVTAEYYKKLREAGVPAEHQLYEGVVHGFFSYPGIFKDDCERACRQIGEFIGRHQSKGKL